MMLSKQFSTKLQADLFGILAMEDDEQSRVVLSPTKVPLPVESVPLQPVRVAMTSGDHNAMPPLSPPTKPKFLSLSLPNSATSSPRFQLLKKWRHDGGQTSPRGADPTTPNFILTVPDLHRSKSCGEGRAFAPPSVDFDALLHKKQLDIVTTDHVKTVSADRQPPPPPPPEEFKCGALCLFIPGFGKGKPVRTKKLDPENNADRVVISRTVSMEKFECGSWASSAVVEESAGGSTANLYFDLPLELIRTSGNETTSPVAAAFVFEKELKGVLKNGGVAARKSVQESGRQVRFSTSSPRSVPTSPGGTCITPRLRKAREEFNAFLEAQSA